MSRRRVQRQEMCAEAGEVRGGTRGERSEEGGEYDERREVSMTRGGT